MITPESRSYAGTTITANNILWIFGGIGLKNNTLGDLWSFQIDSQEWKLFGRTNTVLQNIQLSEAYPGSRYGHILVQYYNYLILYGGISITGQILNSLWIYKINQNKWVKIKSYGIDNPAIAFASACVNEEKGELYIFGGRTNNGSASSDFWILNIEKALQISDKVSSKQKEEISFLMKANYTISDMDYKLVPRYGHKMIQLTSQYLLIYGGQQTSSSYSTQHFAYSINEQKIYGLINQNSMPIIRSQMQITLVGGGSLALFGGIDQNGNVLRDYWHLLIDLQSKQISGAQVFNMEKTSSSSLDEGLQQYFNIIQQKAYGQMLISSTQQFPILFGASQITPNFQDSLDIDQGDILILKDKLCSSQSQLQQLQCLPCPSYSLFNQNTSKCDICSKDSFWNQNISNYFSSSCQTCPEGTEKSEYSFNECTTCQPGYYYKNAKIRCVACNKIDDICPVASAASFPANFSQQFSKIISYNEPPLFQSSAKSFDQTQRFILYVLIGLNVLFFTFLTISVYICKRKTIRTMQYIDFAPVSGGTTKNFIGGIVTFLYYIILFCLIAGVLIKYFLHNQRIEATQLASFEKNGAIEASYKISLKLYVSQYNKNKTINLCDFSQNQFQEQGQESLNEGQEEESSNKEQSASQINIQTKKTQLNVISSQQLDMHKLKMKCSRQIYDRLISDSQNKQSNKTTPTTTTQSSQLKRIKAQTYIYDIEVVCESCINDEDEELINSFLRVNIQMGGKEAEQGSFFVHFFNWEFTSVWQKEVDEGNECELGCSKVQGFQAPQQTDKLSQLEDFNFESAFKGPNPTNINVMLTTAFYTNILEEVEMMGYRAHTTSVEKGSTINMRTGNKNLDIQGKSAVTNDVQQFSVQFKLNPSSNIYQIRVINLKTILESLAEIMGFLAGMSFVARFSKQVLQNHGAFSSYDGLVKPLSHSLSMKNNQERGSIVGASPRYNSPLSKTPKMIVNQSQQQQQNELVINPIKIAMSETENNEMKDEDDGDFNFFSQNLQGVVKK